MDISGFASSFFYASFRVPSSFFFRSKSKPSLALPDSTSHSLTKITSGVFFIHALASPLSSLLITLDLCLETLDQPNQRLTSKQFVNQALLDVKHLQHLLTISHSGYRATKSTFTLKSALQEVVIRLHQPWRQQQVHAHLHLASSLKLKGHAFYFQEALSCLIKNAFEAYGSRRIKTVALTCYQQKQQVIIHISDLGSGMGWVSRQLFDKVGYSSKPTNQGVGLSFVKNIIEHQYRGKLIIQTVKGGGTTITIIVPIRA